MADITNNIKMKDSSGVHDITKMYFKSNSGVKMIKSVWEVKNSNPILIWPKNYDATLTVTPSPNTITGNRAPASGTTINLTWHLTLYYPNTNIVAYDSDVSASRISGDNSSNTHLLRVEDYKTSSTTYEFPVWPNKSEIVIPNRERNGLPNFTGPNNIQLPESDGTWGFFISGAYIKGTYNGGSYSTRINDVGVARQEANNYSQTSVYPVNVDLNYYNVYQNGIMSSNNTQSNPASYTSCTVYGLLTGTINFEYTFTSSSIYTVKHSPNEFEYTWNSDSSWASINSNTWNVTLRENTSPSPRKATISVTVSGERHTYDIWQAGAPDPNTTNP